MCYYEDLLALQKSSVNVHPIVLRKSQQPSVQHWLQGTFPALKARPRSPPLQNFRSCLGLLQEVLAHPGTS